MNVELTIPPELVEQIADRVLQTLLPVIAANNKQKDNSILDVKELAVYLKVDESWIYKRTRNHEIPFIKKGKYCLFRKSAIDAWLSQDAINPISPYAMPKKPL